MPLAAETLGPLLHATVRGASWLVNWLATYAIHSTLFIGIAWVIARSPLGTRCSAAQRANVWRFALLGGVMTATLQSAGALAPISGTMRVASDLSSQMMMGIFVTAASDALAGPAAVTTRVEVRPLWPIVSVALWAVMAGVCLLVLMLARYRFTRRLAPRETESLAIAGNALRELQRRSGSRRALSLRATSRLHSPVAMGRNEIYLPERALAEFDLDHLESMLAHELAHLERRDATWLAAARVIEAVFFFQPLNRLARRQMVEAAELAADAWAVRVTARPLTLARCLARVAEWTSAERLTLAPAMVERRSSSLVQRVRVLTGGGTESPDSRPMRFVIAGILSVMALVAPRAAVGGGESRDVLSPRRIELELHRSGGANGGSIETLGDEQGRFLVRVRRRLDQR
jgi:bla regulator protein blaR1